MSDHFPFQIIEGYRGAAGREEPSVSSSRHIDNDHVIQHFIGETTDHTLTSVLEACHKRLDALLQDRSRIGRHLYDHVLRPLFAVTSHFGIHNQACTDNPSAARSCLDRSFVQLNNVIRQLRRIIRELEEEAIEEFDLVSELCELIKSYERWGHLVINLSIPPQVSNLLTLQEKREVFTITREAVNNCVRHAQASRAIIKLAHSNARIRLAIIDNGIGFCVAQASRQGYGFQNIRKRVEKLGGELQVVSQKGRGTEIIAEFTLEPLLRPA